MSGAATRARGFHVFDADREHLGSFQTFHAAHDWAHLQAALGGVTTPVEVEDRARRITRHITRETCETVIWRAASPGVAPAPPADTTSEPDTVPEPDTASEPDLALETDAVSLPRTDRGPAAAPDLGLAAARLDDAAATCAAAVGGELATALRGATGRSPDAYSPGAYSSGGRTPQPRPPLDAEITGGRRGR
ncbi:MAG: hypothetical protein ACQSGP_27835 [Frankia sp.]